jgi:hypothetical protein
VKFLKSIVQKIVSFFASGKAEAALTQAAELVPKALPIVQEIAVLAPNRTDQEILAVFQKFAVPGAAQYLATPADKRGYLLLQLASQVLAAEVPGVATHILDTAVQLAVTGAKAA